MSKDEIEKELNELINDIEGLTYLRSSKDKFDKIHADIMENNHQVVVKVLTDKFYIIPKNDPPEKWIDMQCEIFTGKDNPELPKLTWREGGKDELY